MFAQVSVNGFRFVSLICDLHIAPLKKDKDDTGKFKKKTFTAFFANTFLIKGQSGKGNDLRQPKFSVDRREHSNFFSFSSSFN